MTHANSSTIIQLDHVTVSGGNSSAEEPRLPKISATVHSGKIVVVRGPNGSGKTTLLRVLTGLITPTTGTVRVFGAAPDERDPRFRRLVAAMIGYPPTAPEITVREHLALVAATWQETTSWRRPAQAFRERHPTRSAVVRASERADKVLAEFGMTPLGDRFPGELSSGQQQLFALALVLARPSKLLLLDEPEQRLDPTRVASLANALVRRRAAGSTIVCTTHSDYLASLIADDILWLGGAHREAPPCDTSPAHIPYTEQPES